MDNLIGIGIFFSICVLLWWLIKGRSALLVARGICPYCRREGKIKEKIGEEQVLIKGNRGSDRSTHSAKSYRKYCSSCDKTISSGFTDEVWD